MKTDLETKLKDSFAKVKSKFGYIPLQKVSLDEKVPTACIDMNDFNIKVNPDFIEKIAENIPLEDAIEGVLDHEAGHYVFHPFDLKRVILEHKEMKDKEFGESARQFYDDVNNNLRVIAFGETTIPDVYRAMAPSSKVEKIILSTYQHLTGKSFGMFDVLDEEMSKAVENLLRINFLNISGNDYEPVKQNEKLNLRDLNRFYKILKPFFEKDEKEGNSPENFMGSSPSVKDYSGKDIKKALKELIEKGLLSPEEAKGLIKEFKDKMKEEGSGDYPGGSFNDNPAMFADRFIYESLASKYSIQLKKTPLIAKTGVHPTKHEKFEVGDDLNDLDPFNSYGGRILPGLSNKWVKEEVRYHGQKEKTPDLEIWLDDSGSMPNPLDSISDAVLSSIVIAREYNANKSAIAVVRFSDETTVEDFTKDKYPVINALLKFKDGKDTMIDLEKVKMLRSQSRPVDRVVITDGEIKNYNEVISYLNASCEEGARAYLVKIGQDKETEYSGKVKIMYLSKPEDIAKIVLDDVHRAK